jgi:SWI/SNF-related matrix-associated actin-dependent regulator of chromatin subfamily A member 5
LGDNLIEYELLQYPVMTQAFYIQCHACTSHFAEAPHDKALCDNMAGEMEREHHRVFGTADTISQAGSLTDAATIDTTTGANTPIVIDEDFEVIGKKRKLKTEGGMKISFKREKLDVSHSQHNSVFKQ